MLEHGAHRQLVFTRDPIGSPMLFGVKANLWPDEVIANPERVETRRSIGEIGRERNAECRLEIPGEYRTDGGRELFVESCVAHAKQDEKLTASVSSVFSR